MKSLHTGLVTLILLVAAPLASAWARTCYLSSDNSLLVCFEGNHTGTSSYPGRGIAQHFTWSGEWNNFSLTETDRNSGASTGCLSYGYIDNGVLHLENATGDCGILSGTYYRQ